nr:hypothetical protein [Mycoplasmopsis bovis]
MLEIQGILHEYSIETINEFVDIYGINPNQIPDYKGLSWWYIW